MSAATPRLTVRDLRVSYGPHEVVHGIDFDVAPGEIIALLGANGSGKSTTVKALTGVNRASASSSVRINGSPLPVPQLSAGEARRRGIRVVHQEAPLISNMSIAEMFALHGGFPVAAGLVRSRELARITRAGLDEFDIRLDPSTLCGDLTAGERALVSLAISMAGIEPERALLILDEATASLATSDSGRLLDRVRAVVGRGLSVVMVTHRLPEVRHYCDRTLVLRDGDLVAEFNRADFSEEAVVQSMVGQSMVGQSSARTEATAEGNRATSSDEVLSATNLAGPGVRSASFSVAAGEILGVTGRAGEGASELLRLLGGVERSSGGTLNVGGRRLVLRGPRDAILAGIYYLSPDRIGEGGVPLMTVAENMVLPRVERYALSGTRRAEDIGTMMTTLDVRPADSGVPFGSLSGGNQQKVLLGRWLLLGPKVLVLDDPTAGVDPHTREVIFTTMQQLREDGTSIVLRSTEPEHLGRLCDRVIVMKNGHTDTVLTASELTTEGISRATYS